MHSMSKLHGQTETLNVLVYVLLTLAVLLLTFPLKRTWHWINKEHCKGDNVFGDGREWWLEITIIWKSKSSPAACAKQRSA